MQASFGHRCHHRCRAPALLLALAAAAPAQTGQVRYQGTEYPPAALPATAPAPARELLAFYGPLLPKLHLRGYLDAAGQCGLLLGEHVQGATSLQSTLDKVNEFFRKAWGSDSAPVPSMVIVIDRQQDVGAVLDHLVPKYAYLADWAKAARGQAGFNLYEPSLYVVVDDRRPKTEFRLPNQIVHQQTLLIVYREFKRVPFWLHEGLAWVAEETLTGRIHAFNHRVGFVAVTEHTGWRSDVRRLAKDKPDLLRMLHTDPTKYEHELSLLAYGTALYLLRQDDHGKQALTALGDAWWAKSSKGEQPSIELLPEEQDKVLTRTLGDDYSKAILDFLRSDSPR